jgi:magnesium-transporting ATPase (P-type)
MAGIKVWVLTGDKVDTAINIGKSAGLIDAETHYEIGEDEKELFNKLVLLEKLCKRRDDPTDDYNQKVGLVLRGDLLPLIQSDDSIKIKFIQVGEKLDIVLACRVAPI